MLGMLDFFPAQPGTNQMYQSYRAAKARSYCLNVHTVMRTPGNVHYDRRGRGMNKVKKKHTKCLIFPEKSIVPFFGENKTKKYNLNVFSLIFSTLSLNKPSQTVLLPFQARVNS